MKPDPEGPLGQRGGIMKWYILERFFSHLGAGIWLQDILAYIDYKLFK
jgi:hypothetical protein